jgi:hypothetical protein
LDADQLQQVLQENCGRRLYEVAHALLDDHADDCAEISDVTDGVTRTIWLLTHCVKAMPVKCPMRDAARLQALAGVDGGQPVAVGTLLKQKME